MESGDRCYRADRWLPCAAVDRARPAGARPHDQHGLPAVLLRPVMVYGPGCQNYVGQVVQHLRRGSLALFDGGRHVAGLAYVENVVDAICLADAVPEALGQTMNVCDDSPVTWRQYFDTLADGLGIRRPRFSVSTAAVYAAAFPSEAIARCLRLRHRPWLTRLAVLELGQPQVYDISLARRILGFAPQVALDEAIEATVRWVRHAENGNSGTGPSPSGRENA
jgi:2-alkyl-3-oxoalkanoate reductase